MKKLFAIMFAVLAVFLVVVPAGAGGCPGVSGECYGPPRPNTGYIGTSTYPWGYGYFYNLTITGTSAFGGTITDTATITGTGTYDYSGATSFDIGQAYDIPINSFFMPGMLAPSDMQIGTTAGATLPYYATSNTNDFAIVWASGSTASIASGYIRIKPWMTSSGLAFRGLFRFGGGTTAKTLNWWVQVQADDATSNAIVAQTAVTVDADELRLNDEVTFTPNATTISQLTSGRYFRIAIQPAANTTSKPGLLNMISGLEYYKP